MKAHYKSFSPPWLLILIFKLLSAHFMQVKLRVYSGYLRPLWNHFPGIHWQCNCRLSNRLDTSNVPRCQMLWLDLEPVLWACFQPSYYMTTQQMVLIHPHNNRHPFLLIPIVECTWCHPLDICFTCFMDFITTRDQNNIWVLLDNYLLNCK